MVWKILVYFIAFKISGQFGAFYSRFVYFVAIGYMYTYAFSLVGIAKKSGNPVRQHCL
jgi:hypothetical protein